MTTKTIQHTPGPWIAEAMKITKNGISTRLGDMICVDKSISADECEANARLVAAAPELLKLLKDIVSPTQANPLPRHCGAVKAALLLIAKAEGL